MLQRGAPVNHYTLSIAIDCFCRLRRPDFGFAILGCFFKCGYKPDMVTFNTLIKGLLLVGRIPEAAKLLFKCGYKPDMFLADTTAKTSVPPVSKKKLEWGVLVRHVGLEFGQCIGIREPWFGDDHMFTTAADGTVK
ncbi:pentatricopeptide repeat protein [Salvia divinorum]|uniref:Pentatricopeptide repeat protein n=1 Tax=Salvia divinorum TaxID=28513 RepID=A0ABD1FX18_SALDI